MQEQNIMTREEMSKYGLRVVLGFSSTKQLRQVYADTTPQAAAHQVAQQAAEKAKGGAQ